MTNAFMAFAEAVNPSIRKENKMKAPKKIPATLKEPTIIKVALRDSADALVTILDKKMEDNNILPTLYIHKGKAYQLNSFSFEAALYREVPCEFTEDFSLITLYETDDGRIILSNEDDATNSDFHEFALSDTKIKRFRTYEPLDISIKSKVTIS